MQQTGIDAAQANANASATITSNKREGYSVEVTGLDAAKKEAAKKGLDALKQKCGFQLRKMRFGRG